SLLCLVMLAVGKTRQLNAAPHVAGIDARSRELIHARVLTLHEGSCNQRHSAANHVHGNYIETLLFVRWQLPEVCAKQIGKWPGCIDPLVPSRERAARRAFHD